MRITVIISTYNSAQLLEKVLWGYTCQSHNDFEIVIADDGSDNKTLDLIELMKKQSGLTINHVWHEDMGFRKTVILNKAIKSSATDYLLFSDGDCIPRSDFVASHVKYAKRGYFLSGGYYKLPALTSEEISKDDILSGRAFDLEWLRHHGVDNSPKVCKVALSGIIAVICNRITTTRATFNGCNTSAWKEDILKVNGFDERMHYGGEDREVGERLVNIGIIPRQIRYSACCIHLDHKRGYINQDALTQNRAIRKETREKHVTRTDYGIISESERTSVD